MDSAYKFQLKRACINRGWAFEDCEIGVKINGIKIDTLRELDTYVEEHA